MVVKEGWLELPLGEGSLVATVDFGLAHESFI